MKYCLELVEGRHSKFWTGETVGSYYIVTYGRIGSQGATQVKKLASNFAASTMLMKIKSEKLGKGYVSVLSDAHPGADPSMLSRLRSEIPGSEPKEAPEDDSGSFKPGTIGVRVLRI